MAATMDGASTAADEQERTVRSAERERAAILDAIPDMAWLKDAQGRFVTVNQRWLDVYGERSVDDVVGRTDFDFAPPELANRYRADDLEVMTTGRPLRVDEELVDICGVAYWIETIKTPVTAADGTVVGTVGIARDITARRLREQQLVEAEWQRRAILDNIQDMAWLKDRDGRFVAVNQKCLDFFGLQRDDVIGKDDYAFYPPAIADRFRADDAEAIRTRRQHCVEEHLADWKGEEHWVETIKMPVLGADGEVLGTTGTARDITDRRRRTEALRSSNADLENRVDERTRALVSAQEMLVRRERLAVLGQLAGGVAHQIRNPLAAILNASYVLRRHVGTLLSANVDDAIRIIQDEIRHVNVIITGLLDYARVRAPDRHPTSIADVVERVVEAAWIPKTVRVERRVDHTVPPLCIDADQIQSAIFNLVHNAVEAMQDTGQLTVEAARHDNAVVISVTDTGPGIAANIREHLFEPLHSSKPSGIGLGLVTARTLVEAHGGRILAANVTHGARFEIHLPLTESRKR